MEDKLVEFANLLRQNGVRVSLAETLDALAASGMIGLGERDAFRGALRATMIKRASELPVFEELFDVYFSGLGEIIKQAGQGVQDALSMSDQSAISGIALTCSVASVNTFLLGGSIGELK